MEVDPWSLRFSDGSNSENSQRKYGIKFALKVIADEYGEEVIKTGDKKSKRKKKNKNSHKTSRRKNYNYLSRKELLRNEERDNMMSGVKLETTEEMLNRKDQRLKRFQEELKRKREVEVLMKSMKEREKKEKREFRKKNIEEFHRNKYEFLYKEKRHHKSNSLLKNRGRRSTSTKWRPSKSLTTLAQKKSRERIKKVQKERKLIQPRATYLIGDNNNTSSSNGSSSMFLSRTSRNIPELNIIHPSQTTKRRRKERKTTDDLNLVLNSKPCRIVQK